MYFMNKEIKKKNLSNLSICHAMYINFKLIPNTLPGIVVFRVLQSDAFVSKCNSKYST